MFALDAEDPTPLYAQLDRAIRLAIATGRLRAGDRLPTVRQLAVDLRINANTVARVYAELERAGVLATRRGVGTTVLAAPDDPGAVAERSRRLEALGERFLADAAALGYSAERAIDHLVARLREGRPSDGERERQEDQGRVSDRPI